MPESIEFSCDTKIAAQEVKDKDWETIADFLEIFLQRCKPRKNKGTRKPSPRNLFIGKCMKEGANMKECSDRWKVMPDSDKLQYQP